MHGVVIEATMRQLRVTFPELALVAVTRAILGAGIGLLIAERLRGRRRAVGLALVAVGALTTIPLAAEILPKRTMVDGQPQRLPEERL